MEAIQTEVVSGNHQATRRRVKGGRSDRRENFLRLSKSRLRVVMDKLRILSNCARKNHYDWTDSDANQIIIMLEKAIMDLKLKFAGHQSGYYPL